ncbi:unnamed protein product [Adineta steineri]|uniref:RWD domain-containing protein n=1 Tax=Adineta steineri TaxID=433720 RepID=A0A815NS02_9BILA|nr:unnamed protein product [Adineta steineri]CAF1416088.1 unnamed protein product [Adineta steineri]CAF1437528.1 unnamed protein product [Adineta steineri]
MSCLKTTNALKISNGLMDKKNPSSDSIQKPNGDENDLDRDKRLLCITFIVEFQSTYPYLVSPKITLCHPPGLTDEQINELNSFIYSCFESNISSCEAYAVFLTLISNRNDIEDLVCRQTLANNVIEQLPSSSSNEQNSNEEHQELIENFSRHIKQ